jgi:hypothetical protein
MEVHRVTFYVVDFDGLGADGVRLTLENTRFPNDCLSPTVTSVETRDIGEWADSHPLNNSATATAELNRLFGMPS